MGHRAHRRSGPASVACAVVTVSDTRTEATDTSGAFIRKALQRRRHRVAAYDILPDAPRRVTAHLRSLARRGGIDVVLLSGGTGIAPRDSTHEAVARVLEKTLPGFGEIFRALSYRQVGAAAMLSRAAAGTYRGLVLFSMPGSEAAVRLAMRRLILPELSHVAGLLPRARG